MSRLAARGGRPAVDLGELVSSISHQVVPQGRSATMNFGKPEKTGTFICGQKWIYTGAGSVEITSIFPASEAIVSAPYISAVAPEGATITGRAFQAHGAVMNPWFVPYVGEGEALLPGEPTAQGFDEVFSVAGVPVSTPGANASGDDGVTAYDPALNIDPGATGHSIIIPRYFRGTIMKAIRRQGGAPYGMDDIGNNRWRKAENYALFHFVDEIPPADAFAPCASLPSDSPHRTNYFRFSQANKASLGAGFTLPASWPAANSNDLCWQPFCGQFGESLRSYVINPNVEGGESSGYSRDYGIRQCYAFGRLLAAGPAADNTEWIKALSIGIQLIGLAQRGHPGVAGAGQAAGFKVQMMMALHAFHETHPDIVDLVLDFRANCTHQQFFANPLLRGCDVKFGADGQSHGQNMKTFMDRHIAYAIPFFGHTLFTRIAAERDLPVGPRLDKTLDSARDTDYEIGSAGSASTPEIICIAALREGPGGRKGALVIAKMANNLSTVTERAASIYYVDMYRTFAGAGTAPGSPAALDIMGDSAVTVLAVAFRDMYDLTRPDWGLDHIDYPPDPGTPTYNKTNIDSGSGGGLKLLVAAAGGVQWDIRNLGHSRLAVVDAEVGYSLDGVQWIPVNTSPPYLHGTQTGLTPSREHRLRWRRSAMVRGVKTYGDWTVDYKRSETLDPSARMRFTPTGSTSDTPVFTVQPQLYVKPYPVWWGPEYDLCNTANFSHLSKDLYAGVGYITGNVASGWGYQWQRKIGAGAWTDIPGQVTFKYTWTEEDYQDGVLLRCRITTTNGAVVAYTNELDIPNISSIDLYALHLPEALPAGMKDAIGTYFNNLKTAVSGDIYEAHDGLLIMLPSAKNSLVNMIRKPGKKVFDARYVAPMSDADFTPFLGWQGNNVDANNFGKAIALGMLDNETGMKWSREAMSLINLINATTDHNSGDFSLGIMVGGNAGITPNLSGNVRGRAHSATNLSSPASGGVRTGWSATIREDETGYYNAKEGTIGTKLSVASTAPSAGELGMYRGGTNSFSGDRSTVVSYGALNRAQYLEFRTITNAFLAVLATYM